MYLFLGHISFKIYTGSLKSMDTPKYFQNGLAELVEIWDKFNIIEFFFLKLVR
jgi:hypothetical protein